MKRANLNDVELDYDEEPEGYGGGYTYGIEIQSGEDEAFLLALTVAIDDMSRD